jgi:hypothetical protein
MVDEVDTVLDEQRREYNTANEKGGTNDIYYQVTPRISRLPGQVTRMTRRCLTLSREESVSQGWHASNRMA